MSLPQTSSTDDAPLDSGTLGDPELEVEGDAAVASAGGSRLDGAALVRATKPFAEEDRVRTWTELLIALAFFGVVEAGALLAPWWPLQLVASLLVALITVRLFIIYHDALHGAVFRKDPLGHAIMWGVGFWSLSPPPVWRETHDYHHKNTCKLPGTSIGSYPVVTTRMWRRMKPGERRIYAFARHPLNILFGYVTIFMGGMILSAFLRRPRMHWPNLLALGVHFGLIGLVTWQLGWFAALCAIVLPIAISSALGGYLFYAQHNYPDAKFTDRQRWTYTQAALEASSMFEMPAVLHWFTGNIGYHHVHHLNHRIPFYRLPEAMAAMPELQHPGRTSWHPRDIAACLRLKLWDPSQGKMVSFAEAQLG